MHQRPPTGALCPRKPSRITVDGRPGVTGDPGAAAEPGGARVTAFSADPPGGTGQIHPVRRTTASARRSPPLSRSPGDFRSKAEYLDQAMNRPALSLLGRVPSKIAPVSRRAPPGRSRGPRSVGSPGAAAEVLIICRPPGDRALGPPARLLAPAIVLVELQAQSTTSSAASTSQRSVPFASLAFTASCAAPPPSADSIAPMVGARNCVAFRRGTRRT